MKNDARPETMSYLQTVTIVAVIVFALLLVTVERPLRISGQNVLPVGLGIVGLLFVAAGLTAMTGFREGWRADRTVESGNERSDLVPTIFEVGLWALAALYFVRLVEIARG
jgi:hypothetical protein